MKGFIDGINFHELEAMKYWAAPSTWSDEKKRTTQKERILSGDWLGARKMDGSFWKFVKDENGNMELLGRSKSVNGDYLDKIEWVPQCHEFFNELPNGTCLLGELYFPNREGSKEVTTIMGCLKEKAVARQEKGDKLHFYVFDCLAWKGASWVGVAAEDRFNFVMRFKAAWECVDFARYFSGQELMNELGKILNRGGEGIVITHKSAVYEPGKRPSKTTLKIKKEIQETIDCFFTGKFVPPNRPYTGKEIETWKYWENSRTYELLPEGLHYHEYYDGVSIEPVTKSYYYGMAGSLEVGVFKNGEIVPIGLLSGLTEEIKLHPDRYKGRCIEVSCMEIFDTGERGLRHAKMIGFRDDLTPQDCTWEKIFE